MLNCNMPENHFFSIDYITGLSSASVALLNKCLPFWRSPALHPGGRISIGRLRTVGVAAS